MIHCIVDIKSCVILRHFHQGSLRDGSLVNAQYKRMLSFNSKQVSGVKPRFGVLLSYAGYTIGLYFIFFTDQVRILINLHLLIFLRIKYKAPRREPGIYPMINNYPKHESY